MTRRWLMSGLSTVASHFQVKLQTMVAFNKEFDKAVNEALLFTVKGCIGCFSCGKGKSTIENGQLVPSADFPPHQCSKCSVARYCNKMCQRSHWKPIHKQECRMFCENRDADFCLIECLMGCHWINEDTFQAAMRDRKDAFLEEMAKQAESVNLGMTVAVIHQFDKLRLVAAVRFVNDDSFSPIDVNHVIHESVDHGGTAIANINRGSGKISQETLERVLDIVEDFCDGCTGANCRVGSMTLGRGLVSKCDEFEERFKPKNGGIIIIPSSDYIMTDVMSAAMEASGMFGFRG